MMLKVYAYSNCDTCRKALKFLRSAGVEFEEIPIRERPPSEPELRSMLAAHGGEIRKLFNTSGRDYKAQGLSEKLPRISADQAIALLASNGNLVKRPFVLGDSIRLIGFRETDWQAAFDAR